MAKVIWKTNGSNNILYEAGPFNWGSMTIDNQSNLTVYYKDKFKEKTLIKKCKRNASAMNIGNYLANDLCCHFRGEKEIFDVKLRGSGLEENA